MDQKSRNLQSLTLLREGKFSDFTIVCQGYEFSVHRVTLAARSEWFRKCLDGGFSEASSQRVELQGDRVDLVAAMIHYFYVDDYDDNPQNPDYWKAYVSKQAGAGEEMMWDRTTGQYISGDFASAEEVAWDRTTGKKSDKRVQAYLTFLGPVYGTHGTAMEYHIWMWAMADKYEARGLALQAKNRFHAALPHCTAIDVYTNAIEAAYLYAPSPPGDHYFKDRLLYAVLAQAPVNGASTSEMYHKVPEFAGRLTQLLMNAMAHRSPQMGCVSNGRCQYIGEGRQWMARGWGCGKCHRTQSFDFLCAWWSRLEFNMKSKIDK